MKSYRKLAVVGIGLCAVLLMAACSGTSTGSGNTGTPATTAATATATAKPKPKPTAVPHFTVAYCNQLMTLDEMNTLMTPPASAATIVPTNGDSGGACNYEATKTNIPLIIYFFAWNGPVPIPEDDIVKAIAQLASLPGMTVNTSTAISGIGQQAEYVEATGSGGAQSAVMHIFYVLEGPFIFDCFTYSPLSAGFLGTQDQLQQCATQVDSRL